MSIICNKQDNIKNNKGKLNWVFSLCKNGVRKYEINIAVTNQVCPKPFIVVKPSKPIIYIATFQMVK